MELVGPEIEASVEAAYALKSNAVRFQERWTGPLKPTIIKRSKVRSRQRLIATWGHSVVDRLARNAGVDKTERKSRSPNRAFPKGFLESMCQTGPQDKSGTLGARSPKVPSKTLDKYNRSRIINQH
jgi:hypothetical protein